MKFELWSIWHILYIISPLIFMAGIYYLIRNKSEKTKHIVGIVLGTLSLVMLAVRNLDIFIRNGWDCEVIPLQVCHLGNIIVGLGLITKKKFLILTGFCFNLIPAICAMVFADSLTNYSSVFKLRAQGYVWGHIVIVVGAIYSLLIYKPKFNKKDVAYSLTLVGTLSVVAIFCNSAFRHFFNWEPNYFYLFNYKGTPLKFLYTPFEPSKYGWFEINWFYVITLISFFVLVYFMLYFVAKAITNKLNKTNTKIKAIMFDFDGTLTTRGLNFWKKIWIELGYDLTDKTCEYYTQFEDYLSKKITYQEWCDQNTESFNNKNFNVDLITKLASTVELNNGFESFIKTLKNNNISLHIISGNFVEVIEQIIGENTKYFDSINANRLDLNPDGTLKCIIGTNYDFEGKAQFILEYKEKHNLKPEEICFVGNGDNDEYAHLSGCKTICINPDKTDGTNKTLWHTTLNDVTNLNQLLNEILK